MILLDKEHIKAGQRVYAVNGYDGNEKIVGLYGTIINDIAPNGLFAVEFDESVGGHSGVLSDGKYGYCWNYVSHSEPTVWGLMMVDNDVVELI